MKDKDNQNNNLEKIMILGDVGSGKTCFFAGLYRLSFPDCNSKFILSAEGETKKYLENLYSYLSEGKEIPATEKSKVFKLDMRVGFKGRKFEISTLDIAGEDYKNFQTDLPQNLTDVFSESDIVFFLLDILKGKDKEDINDKCKDVLNFLGSERLAGKKVGILLTKSEDCLDKGEDPERFLKKEHNSFYKKIKQTKRDVGFFFISSLGGENLKSINPKGYEELFTWISRNALERDAVKMWNKNKYKYFLVAGVVTLFVVGWFLLFIQDYNEEKRREIVIKETNEIIEKINTDSSTNRDLEKVEEIIRSGELALDKEEEARKAQEKKYKEMEKEALQTMRAYADFDAAISYGNDFLAKYNDKDYKFQVIEKEMIRLKADKIKKNKRDIYSMPMSSRPDVKIKLQKIKQFDFPKKEDYDAAMCAIVAFERLMNKDPYKIVIAKADKLKKSKKTYVKITIGESKPLRAWPPLKGMNPHWEKEKDFGWAIRVDSGCKGDDILVEWKEDNTMSSNSLIAKKKYRGWTAFLEMLSSLSMDVVKKDLVDGDAVITITCEEFKNPQETLENIKKFVYPGEYFKN